MGFVRCLLLYGPWRTAVRQEFSAGSAPHQTVLKAVMDAVVIPRRRRGVRKGPDGAGVVPAAGAIAGVGLRLRRNDGRCIAVISVIVTAAIVIAGVSAGSAGIAAVSAGFAALLIGDHILGVQLRVDG